MPHVTAKCESINRCGSRVNKDDIASVLQRNYRSDWQRDLLKLNQLLIRRGNKPIWPEDPPGGIFLRSAVYAMLINRKRRAHSFVTNRTLIKRIEYFSLTYACIYSILGLTFKPSLSLSSDTL